MYLSKSDLEQLDMFRSALVGSENNQRKDIRERLYSLLLVLILKIA